MAEIIPLLDESEKVINAQDALFTDNVSTNDPDALTKAINAEYKKVTGPQLSGAQKALNATDQFNSAQYGEAKTLGKPLNLSGSVAYDNIESLKPKKNIITENIQKALRDNPEMNALFSDPEFMAVAKEDIGLITRLSDIGQSLGRGLSLGTGMGAKGIGDIIETTQEFGEGNIKSLLPDVFLDKYRDVSQKLLSSVFPEQFDGENPEAAEKVMNAILFGNGDVVATATSDVLKWGGKELKELIPELPKANQTNITQVSEALGQMTGQIATAILNPAVGTALLLGQGVDQQTSRIEQLEQQGQEFTAGEKLIAQTGGGLITWGTEKALMPWLTKYLPESAQEKIGNNFASRVLDKIMGRTSELTQKVVGKRIADALAGGVGEFGQELTENVLQEVLSRIALEPDNPMWKGLDEELKFLADTTGQSLVAGEAATVFQLLISFGLGKKNRDRLSEQAQADKVNMALGELSDLAKESKMQTNSVDDFKAFIKSRFGDSKFMVDNEAFKTMFQGLKTEEQEQMVENMPYLQEQINEAGELGTDIEIPVEDYAAYIAAEVYHDELARHVTSEYGDMSLAQAELDREIMLSDMKMELEDQVKESMESDEYSTEQKQVLRHIQNELVKSGQDADASAQQSELFAATVRAYASRGYDAKQIVDAILNISINKSLSTKQTNVDTLTMAIKDVQAGNIPTQPEMFGETLSQFLRKIGLNDQGGELSARDVDVNLDVFVAKMIKEGNDGVDLDRAVEMAAEAGFIEDVPASELGPEHLLEALDRELAGEPVFSSQNRNEVLINRQQDLEMMADYIQELGLEDKTAEEIRDLLINESLPDSAAMTLAQDNGYEGSQISEARVWNRATASGLDMSKDARMERAKAMGFDVTQTFYHGTNQDFESFENKQDRDYGYSGQGYYFAEGLWQSSFYAQSAENKSGGAAVNIPVHLRLRNPYFLQEFSDQPQGMRPGQDESFTANLIEQGHDGVIFQLVDRDSKTGEIVGTAIEEIVVFDPENIRSTHAAFDPAYSESSKLLAQGAVAKGNKSKNKKAEFSIDGLVGHALWGDLNTVKKADPIQYAAVIKQLDAMDVDERARVLKNLTDFAGTPYASATIRSLLGRELFQRHAAGESTMDIDQGGMWGNSKMDLKGNSMMRAIAKGGPELAKFIQGYNFVSPNIKTELDFSGSMINCDPSLACATFCYSVNGQGGIPGHIIKAEFTEWVATHFADQLADNIENRYNRNPGKAANLALRMNEKGDLSEVQLRLVDKLNDKGIQLQIFSKRPDILRRVSPINWRALSVDSTNMQVAYDNPDLALAVVITDDLPQQFIKDIDSRVSVYLPVNLKGGQWSRRDLAKMYPDVFSTMKGKICPVDGGTKIKEKGASFVTIVNDAKNKKQNNTLTCMTCDLLGSLGCFNGDRNSKHLRDAVELLNTALASPEKKAKLVESAKDGMLEQLTKMKELGAITDEQFTDLYESIINAVGPATAAIVKATDGTGNSNESIRNADAYDVRTQEEIATEQSERNNRDKPGTGPSLGDSRLNITQLNQPAFHGTPNREINKFSTDYIGDGEGAQAYGWGLYFASNRDIAEDYKRSLVPVKVANEILEVNDDDDYAEAFEESLDAGEYQGDTKALLTALRDVDWLGYDQPFDAVVDVIVAPQNFELSADLKKAIDSLGQVHRVEVPDVDMLIDYNLPLSEQPQAIQDKLTQRGAFDIDKYPRTREAIMFDATGRSIQMALEQDIFSDLGGGSLASKEAPRLASQKFNELGIPGLQYTDASSDESSKNFVIWNDDAIDMAETFYQDQESSNRANIQLPQNILTEQTIINLFEKNDFSSMLHESGHFFLELQRELAKQGGPAADDQVIVKDWWLKNIDSLATESGLTVKQMKKYIKTGKLDTAENEAAADTALHEQFARGFEKYLFTGKAPSIRLQGVFQRYKAWLTQIYKQLKNLNVDIDENITAVFDRMLASDMEIEQAQNEMQYSDVVADSDFLSEDEAEELRQLSIKARDEETAQALKVALKENKYKLSQAYKKRKEVVRREVEQDVTSRKPFRAQKMILFGYDPDGNVIDAKLNLKALKSLVGKSAVAALGKKFSYGKYGVTRKDGVDPLQVANYLDYGSVDLMVDDLLSMPKLKDQVEAETNERMTQEFQAREFKASEDAIALVHGNERERLLDAELQALSTQVGVRKQSSKIIKDAARRVVAKLAMKNLQPYRYKQAETKAARDVEKALLDGNVEAAREAKYRQLKNFHLFTESTKAKEQAELDQKMLNKYRKSSVRKVVDNVYLEQIDGVLFNFELRPNISLTAQMKSRQVKDFLIAQEKEGHTPYISDKMASQIAAAEKQHYKEMTVTEFNEVVDAVKWLRHLSDTKTGLKAEQDERIWQEEKGLIMQSIHDNSPLLGKDKISRSSLTKKLGKMFSIGHAELLLPEAFAKLVDGGKIGAFYKAFFQPISDAADVAGQWKLDVGKRFNNTAKKYYSKMELARFGGLSARRVHIKGIDEYLSKEEILGVALNTGNENNRFKLLDGRQWNEAVLNEILSHMDGNDWNFVQDIWNLIDSEFKQKLSDLELKMEGLPMQMVEPTPFTNQYGTFNGGYYPIVYESDTVKTAKHAEAKTYKELMGMSVAKTTTRSGAVEARVEQTGFAIRLDFSTILANHVNEMVQDITHRESVMKVYKMINDPDISTSLVDTFGIDTYRTLQQWLGDSAGAGREPAGKFAKVARHMRVGVSVVSMGMSVMTALQNYTGLFVSMNEVPTGRLLKSFVKMHFSVVPAIAGKTVGWTAKKIGVPEQLVAKYVDKMVNSPYLYIAKQKEILALSPYLKNRSKIFDHDINEELRGLSVSGQLTPSKSFIFGLIAMVDKAVVIPTWEAAYEDAVVNKNMEQSEAITHADSVVRMTQGSGRQVDLSRIAADPGIASLFTNFFSYFNAMYSRYWSTYRNTRTKGIKETWPRVLSEITFTWVVSSLLAEFLAGRMPDTDDEDWDRWFLRTLALYPTMTLPLIRDMATSSYAKLDDSAPDYGYTLSPVEMGIKDLIIGSTALVDNVVNDDEITPQEVKAMFKATGFWLHLPGTQAYRTSEHFYNWMAGESDFSLYDATYGEKKK